MQRRRVPRMAKCEGNSIRAREYPCFLKRRRVSWRHRSRVLDAALLPSSFLIETRRKYKNRPCGKSTSRSFYIFGYARSTYTQNTSGLSPLGSVLCVCLDRHERITTPLKLRVPFVAIPLAFRHSWHPTPLHSQRLGIRSAACFQSRTRA